MSAVFISFFLQLLIRVPIIHMFLSSPTLPPLINSSLADVLCKLGLYFLQDIYDHDSLWLQ